MVVLKAIGRFFARIGRWIRDTAWVQPLLIVGGIFAIIFAIPYITKWVQSWFAEGDAAVEYYKDYKLSLEGSENKKSEADELLQYITTDARNDATLQKKFGEKFFVTFVQEDCASCETNYKGFNYAQEAWGSDKEFTTYSDGTTAKASDFKIYSIFIDEYDDDDNNYFTKWFYESYGGEFEDIAAIETPYKVKTSANYESLSDKDSFTSPTVFLIDFAFVTAHKTAKDTFYEGLCYGVSEIIFEFPGKDSQTTNVSYARSIWDCWNHIGQFKDSSTNK